jgi:predicted amidophosphoribosyltransferase
MNDEELRRASDALAPDLVPPPLDAPDVCPMCRSWRPNGVDLCDNCQQTFEEVSRPCPRVLPICLYAKPSAMRDRLTYYKDGTPEQKRRYAPEIAIIVARWFAEHEGALRTLTGGWDFVTVVPSATREPPQPLASALLALESPHAPALTDLLVRHLGEIGHRKLSDEGFRPSSSIDGSRVLLLDDVYTTGGTAQSAASALQFADADVVALIPIARRINPDYRADVRALWERQSALSYRFTDAQWWEL